MKPHDRLLCIKEGVSVLGKKFIKNESYEIFRVFDRGVMLTNEGSNITIGEKELKKNFKVL